MSNLNHVVLMGRLTKDPELRYTQSGIPVASFTLAINEFYKNKAEEKKETTTFIDCEVWRKLAEVLSEHMKKGSGLCVMGKLRLDKWEKDGQKRSKVKVLCTTVKFLPKGPVTTKPIPETEEQETLI